MAKNEDEIVDFHIDTQRQGSCFFKLLSLFWLPFLIFLAVLAGYFKYLPLKVEIHSVIMIGAIFVIYFFFMKHNAHYAACKFRRRHKEMHDVMSWYIGNNRLTIGDITKANAPIETFFKDFTASLRNDNFSSVAAGVFPTLGILGTFISIAITMPDFSSQDSAMLEKEISLLLGGVGTAFYVSIYGIFLSLWWTYFEKSGMSRFEKDIYVIKENVHHRFWTSEEIEQIHFQESLKNSEKLNAVFEKMLSSEFVDSMNATLNQRLELFENIVQNEKIALQNASNHYSEVLKNSETSIRVNNQNLESYENIAFRMQDFTSQLQKSNHVLATIQNSLAQKEQNLANLSQNIDKNIAELNKSLKSLNPENIKELYSGVMQNIEIMRSESAKIGHSFNTHLNDFDEKYTQKLKSSLELIDSESAKIIKNIAKLNNV